MNDCIKAIEIALGEIPDVLLHLLNVLRGTAEIAASKKVGIKTNNCMSCRTQEWPCHGADISFVTGQKYSHTAPLKLLPASVLAHIAGAYSNGKLGPTRSKG